MNEGKILVVDDRIENLELIEAMLEAEGYHVITAENGQTALELIEQESIDLVLLDILMPGMDGFDVCREIKFERGHTELPVIMVTALDAREDKLKSLNMGADDFLTKPIDWTELIARVRAALRLKSTYNQLEIQYKRLDHQLELARVVQRELTRVEIPPALKGEVFYSPVDKIGGDIYDVVEFDQNRYGIFLADSSGHGVPAALIMVMVKLIFSSIEKNGLTPGSVLSQINHRLFNYFSGEMDNLFITAIYLIVDKKEQEISWSNGGHPRPLLISPGTGAERDVEKLVNGETPLGIIKEPGFQTEKINYQTGSHLFLYTDGLLELLEPGKSVLLDETARRIMPLFNLNEIGRNQKSKFHRKINKLIEDGIRDDDICYCLFQI